MRIRQGKLLYIYKYRKTYSNSNLNLIDYNYYDQ